MGKNSHQPQNQNESKTACKRAQHDVGLMWISIFELVIIIHYWFFLLAYSDLVLFSASSSQCENRLTDNRNENPLQLHVFRLGGNRKQLEETQVNMWRMRKLLKVFEHMTFLFQNHLAALIFTCVGFAFKWHIQYLYNIAHGLHTRQDLTILGILRFVSNYVRPTSLSAGAAGGTGETEGWKFPHNNRPYSARLNQHSQWPVWRWHMSAAIWFCKSSVFKKWYSSVIKVLFMWKARWH